MAFSLSAQQLSVKHMTGHPTSEVISIRPYLQLINDGSEATDLSDIAIEYYFYDTTVTAADLSWELYHCPLGNVYNLQFLDLDKTYEVKDRKANLMIQIVFSSGLTLAPGANLEMRHGIFPVEWQHTFKENDDWSYAMNESYVYNENIVIRKISTNEIIYGKGLEVNNPRPYNVAVNWLGTHSAVEIAKIDVHEGDAYLNNEDGVTYVYFQETWTILSHATQGGDLSNYATKEYVDNEILNNTYVENSDLLDGMHASDIIEAASIGGEENYQDILIKLELIYEYANIPTDFEFDNEDFKAVKNIRTLNNINAPITALATIDKNTGKVVTLDLSKYNLEEITEATIVEIKKLSSLQTLLLSDNRLTSFPDRILDLINLSSLDLSNNRIPQIPASIKDFNNLSELNMNNTGLMELPAEINEVGALTVLTLNNNNLTDLPTELDFFRFTMRKLDISHNKFTNFPQSVYSLERLEVLDASNNFIETISPKVGQFQYLQSLALDSNFIKELPEDEFKQAIGFIREISLEHNFLLNPFVSWGDIEGDHKWYVQQRINFLDFHLVKKLVEQLGVELNIIEATTIYNETDDGYHFNIPNGIKTLDLSNLNIQELPDYIDLNKYDDNDILLKYNLLSNDHNPDYIQKHNLNLKKLNLSNNKLTKLSDEIMNNFREYWYNVLDVSNNELTDLPVLLLNYSKQKWTFDLSMNRLYNPTPIWRSIADEYDPDWFTTQKEALSNKQPIIHTDIEDVNFILKNQYEEHLYEIDVNITDSEGDAFTVTCDKPEFTYSNGKIIATINNTLYEKYGESFFITVNAYDEANGKVWSPTNNKTWNINILRNRAPYFTSGETPIIKEIEIGKYFSEELNIGDADGDLISVSIEPSVFNTSILNNNRLRIYGPITKDFVDYNEQLTVKISISDAYTSTTKDIIINVPANKPPIVESTINPLQSVRMGESYSQTFKVKDYENGIKSITLNVDGLYYFAGEIKGKIDNRYFDFGESKEITATIFDGYNTVKYSWIIEVEGFWKEVISLDTLVDATEYGGEIYVRKPSLNNNVFFEVYNISTGQWISEISVPTSLPYISDLTGKQYDNYIIVNAGTPFGGGYEAFQIDVSSIIEYKYNAYNGTNCQAVYSGKLAYIFENAELIDFNEEFMYKHDGDKVLCKHLKDTPAKTEGGSWHQISSGGYKILATSRQFSDNAYFIDNQNQLYQAYFYHDGQSNIAFIKKDKVTNAKSVIEINNRKVFALTTEGEIISSKEEFESYTYNTGSGFRKIFQSEDGNDMFAIGEDNKIYKYNY